MTDQLKRLTGDELREIQKDCDKLIDSLPIEGPQSVKDYSTVVHKIRFDVHAERVFRMRKLDQDPAAIQA